MAIVITDWEYTKGVVTPRTLSGSEVWTTMPSEWVIDSQYIGIRIGDIDAPIATVCWRNKLKPSVLFWNEREFFASITLNASSEFEVTAEGNVLNMVLQPDSRGVEQEIWLTVGAGPRERLTVLSISTLSYAYTGLHSTSYVIEHRTIGDGVTKLTSAFEIRNVVTTAETVTATPTVSFVATYNESDPTKLTAKYAVSFSEASTADVYLNLVRSNPKTGAVENNSYMVAAGTTLRNLYYNFDYSTLNPDITEVKFQINQGTGYVSASTVAVTRALNKPVMTSLIATGGGFGRSGTEYENLVQDSSLGYLFKPGSVGFAREAFIEWNLAAQNMPTTLKLYIENYAEVDPGSIEVYAMADFDPLADTWASTRLKKGVLLGSVPFQGKNGTSPYANINLGQVAVSGHFAVLIAGTGFSSSVPYRIAKVGSVNPPALTETVVSNTVNIKTYGTPTGVGDADAVLLETAYRDCQSKGQRLLIDETTTLILEREVVFAEDDVWITNNGVIRLRLRTHSRANDWIYSGVLETGTPYAWSDVAGTPSYEARQVAYRSSYRILKWSGDRGRYDGTGWIDGSFDNSNLATWGAIYGSELLYINGDEFVGHIRVRNGGGSGIEMVSDNCDVFVEGYDCGYACLRVNIQRNVQYMKVKFHGGKQSVEPASRASAFILNGTSYIQQLDMPELVIKNGTLLFEGVVGNKDENGNTLPEALVPYFKNIWVGLCDIELNTPYGNEWQTPATYIIGKMENCENVVIDTLIERTTLDKAGSFWCYLLTKLTIGNRDSSLLGFRPAPDTTITVNKQVRTNNYQALNNYWFNWLGNYTVNIGQLIIDNQGNGPIPSSFRVFRLSDRTGTPLLTIGSVDNVDLTPINLVAFSSTTSDDIVKVTNNTLAAENITIESRLLAP